MGRFGKYLAIVSVNVLVFWVLLESAGVAVYYFKERHLFYFRSTSPDFAPRTDVWRTGLTPATRHVVHPVLGFIGKPGTAVTDVVSREQLDRMAGSGSAPEWTALRTNNFGFFSSHDYPYIPTDKPFLIGVFGGSVAQWFALQGAPVLVDRLRQTPRLADRHIEVLNFGQGAYKQPQQLHALAYFLATGQPLDFVVNIDGFNDVALSLINIETGIDPSLPSTQQLLPLVSLLSRNSLSPERIEAFARAQRGERLTRSVERQMAQTPSAGIWLVLNLPRQMFANAYQTANLEIASGTQTEYELVHVNPWPLSGGPETSFHTIVSTWTEASLLMNSMLCARGIPYLHVLQPNQYHSHKKFSEVERRLAISSDSPFLAGVRGGYPRLVESISAIRSRGANAVSAVGIFDETQQTVFADNCCHLNQLGNDILASFVADRIVESLDSQHSYSSCTPISSP